MAKKKWRKWHLPNNDFSLEDGSPIDHNVANKAVHAEEVFKVVLKEITDRLPEECVPDQPPKNVLRTTLATLCALIQSYISRKRPEIHLYAWCNGKEIVFQMPKADIAKHDLRNVDIGSFGRLLEQNTLMCDGIPFVRSRVAISATLHMAVTSQKDAKHYKKKATYSERTQTKCAILWIKRSLLPRLVKWSASLNGHDDIRKALRIIVRHRKFRKPTKVSRKVATTQLGTRGDDAAVVQFCRHQLRQLRDLRILLQTIDSQLKAIQVQIVCLFWYCLPLIICNLIKSCAYFSMRFLPPRT